MKALFDTEWYVSKYGDYYRKGDDGHLICNRRGSGEYRSMATNKVIDIWLRLGFIKEVRDGMQ